MPVRTTYTEARANFAKLCDRVAADRDTVIIVRRGAENVALVSAAELASLEETAHLLRSPANVVSFLTALNRALQRTEKPETVESLRRETGIDVKE